MNETRTMPDLPHRSFDALERVGVDALDDQDFVFDPLSIHYRNALMK